MTAISEKRSDLLGLFVFALLCATGAASAQEGVARISEFSGQVSILRAEEMIVPVMVGKVIRNALLLNGDLVQTKKGTANILFDDGSILKLQSETMIVINPPSEKFRPAAAQEVAERRIRIVVGKLWTFIEPKATAKTIFELPDGVAAVRGCAGNFYVGWNGDYQIRVGEGTFLPNDLRAGIGWEQNAGSDVSVDRVPGGIRIRNARGGQQSIALNFLTPGGYDIVADQGGVDLTDSEGNARSLAQGGQGTFNLGGAAVTLKPGCSIIIILRRRDSRPIGQLAGLAPFPYQTFQNVGWRTSVSRLGRPGTSTWFGQVVGYPSYARDDRRDPQFSNNRSLRSIATREANQGTVREGTTSSSYSSGPMPPLPP